MSGAGSKGSPTLWGRPSPFEKDEFGRATMITHARDAVVAVVLHGIEFAMNNFDRSFLNNGLAV